MNETLNEWFKYSKKADFIELLAKFLESPIGLTAVSILTTKIRKVLALKGTQTTEALTETIDESRQTLLSLGGSLL